MRKRGGKEERKERTEEGGESCRKIRRAKVNRRRGRRE